MSFLNLIIKMKEIYKALTLIALVAALAACKKGENQGRNTIGVFSGVSTRADANVDASLQPLFVFFTSGNFNNSSVSAPEFFVCTPDGEIDDYKTTAYNTQVRYPLYDRVVYSAGLAPVPGTGSRLAFVTAGQYDKFNVVQGDGSTDDKWGTTDIMTTSIINGKDSSPMGMLYFNHALTKISFSAKLATSMSKYVKYVKVEFPGTFAAKSVEWDATSGYTVKYGATPADDFVFGNYWTTSGDDRANYTLNSQLNKTDALSMGYTLIKAPGSSMTFKVKYKVTDRIDGFDTPDYPLIDVEKEITIQFKDGSTDVSLAAGDAYSITMVIDAFDIELVGNYRPWQNGGFVGVPFHATQN